MSDQDINKCLTKYYKEENAMDIFEIVFKYVEDYGNKNLQIRMIKKIFQFAQKQLTKQNTNKIVTRYFYLINQILNRNQNLRSKYKQAISSQIVGHFISLLKAVFVNTNKAIFPKMKMYRKQWVKLITQQAYNELNKEAISKMNINLDKGFDDKNISALLKYYKFRKFTVQQINKYMPAEFQQSLKARKGSTVSPQSDEEQEKPRKKYKKQSVDRRSSERRSQYSNSDMVNPSLSSYIPSNSYVNGYGVDPRRPNQAMYPPMHSIYPPLPNPNPYFPPNRVNYPPVGQYAQQNFYPPVSYASSYGYPNNYNPPLMPNMQTMPGYGVPAPYDPYRDPRNRMPPQPRPQIQSDYLRTLQKIGNTKNSWSFQCKFCGILISTNQKYDQHMFNHFSQSQKQYEISHSRTQHQKKPNKSLMPSIQEWIESNRIKAKQQKFVVPIQGGISTGNQNCMICKGQLKVTWSDQIESWVYEDAVRTKNPDAHKSICHVDCFQAIDQFEKSSDELIR